LFTAVQLKSIRREALDNLVRRELLYQESRKNGVTVPPPAVDAELASLKTRFANEIEFSSALESAHLSEGAIRRVVERGLAIRGYVDRQFAATVTVSEEEKKAYFRGHPELFTRPLRVRISHILVRTLGLDEKARKEARGKIAAIRERLRQGEPFDVLARASSECGSGAQGGDLGYFRRGEMARNVEEAALALRPGETSGIVEDHFGYHLIRLTNIKPEQSIAYGAAEKKIADYLRQEKALERANRYVEELRKSQRVEVSLPEE
jgi:peptidyl-prolyl cis-trans isomerase C